MALYLDSARLADAQAARAWGFVAGATTNPALLAEAGGPREELVLALCRTLPGPVFVQLTAADAEGLEAEGRALHALSPSQIHLKVPCTLAGLQVVARLATEIPCAVTALFSPAQAWLAAQAGARYVIPYVNRSTRLLGDGPALVKAIAGVLAGTPARILAASVKSPEEAVAALNAGAQDLTLPLEVIVALAAHPLTDAALAEFARQARA
jgi:transaldolase